MAEQPLSELTIQQVEQIFQVKEVKDHTLQNPRRSHAMGECTIFLFAVFAGDPRRDANDLHQRRFHVGEFGTNYRVHGGPRPASSLAEPHSTHSCWVPQ